MFSCVWNFKASASLFMSGTSVPQWLVHQETLQLSCCWLWSAPERWNLHLIHTIRKIHGRKHARPQKLFLTLPLTYSIMLYSKCKQRLDWTLELTTGAHLPLQAHSTSTRCVSCTSSSPMDNRLCLLLSFNSPHRLFTAVRTPTLDTVSKIIN